MQFSSDPSDGARLPGQTPSMWHPRDPRFCDLGWTRGRVLSCPFRTSASGLASEGHPGTVASVLKLGRGEFADTDLLVMAIVNRTRDSFYDRGATWSEERALGRVRQAVAEGADLVDIGGVKAGPGEQVDAAEEIRRTAALRGRRTGRVPRPRGQCGHLAARGGPGGVRRRRRRAERRLGRARPGARRGGRGVRHRPGLHAHQRRDPAHPAAPARRTRTWWPRPCGTRWRWPSVRWPSGCGARAC